MTNSQNADGGPSLDGRSRGQAWLVGTAFGLLVLAALVVAFIIGTNYSDEPTPAVGSAPAPAPVTKEASGPGKALFIQTCGACHTLKDAGTKGTIGPDLDTLAPDASLVESAIAAGGAGSGTMPPGLLTGEEATAVATYIANSTGGG